MITLAPGLRLPFAEGEVICGSVMVFSADIGVNFREVFIARPNGDVLLELGADMPRDPAPAPGWSFTLGPKQTFQPPLSFHDMVVTHGGVSIRTASTGEPVLLRAPDGEFLVSARGYVTVGHLSDLEAYLGKKGYDLSIVRVVAGSQPDRVPAP